MRDSKPTKKTAGKKVSPKARTSKDKKGRFKPGKKLAGAVLEQMKIVQLTYSQPDYVCREVPNPDRDTAVAIGKTVLEHTYWLGRAVRDGDVKAAQREIDVITRFSSLYTNFAGNPNNQPLKFSSCDNYPENLRHKKKFGKTVEDDGDDEN